MKRYFTSLGVLISFFIATIGVAQQQTTVKGAMLVGPNRMHSEQGSSSPKHPISNFPSAPLSPLVVIPGADATPISTRWDIISNGRASHTLAVDPDDPMKLHFVTMILTDNTIADTMPDHSLTSRRVAYTYSSNGGASWSPQILVGTVRLGYPDIQLYKRDGKWLPIIAAHEGPITTEGTDTTFETRIFIEQGEVGTGDFKMFKADRNGSTGTVNDFGFPSIRISDDQNTLYVVACAVQASKKSVVPAPLEFGTFSLDATRGATWNGWKVRPGGDGSSSKSAGGQYILREAPNGTLGLLWVQGDNDDKSLYFVESTDQGLNWTETYSALYLPFTDNGSLYADYDGMDVVYDANSRPRFVWQVDGQLYATNRFLPYNAGIFYWGLGDKKAKLLISNGASQTLPDFSSGMLMFDTAFVDIDVVNVASYFNSDEGSGFEPTGNPFASDVTTAASSNPDVFRVYYSTFQDDDAIDVDQDDLGTTKTYLYRNIYYLQTRDGGTTWSEPIAYLANPPGGPLEAKLDYHHPVTAPIYKEVDGRTTFHVMFAADTTAGTQFGFGTYGWSFNSWFHAMNSFSGVKNSNNTPQSILGQNYPNPVLTKTSIPIELAQNGTVSLVIEDMLGRTVRTVFSGELSAGSHTIPVKIGSLSAGVYRYTITTPYGIDSRLMTIVQ